MELQNKQSSHRRGVLLVAAAALCWSSGGYIARHIAADVWTQICWRGAFAGITLLAFLLIRERRRTWGLFRSLGLPGLAVGACFTIAPVAFVIALRHTSVANILVIQSTTPFIAALLARLWMGEQLHPAKISAMLIALLGIVIMISGGQHPTIEDSSAGWLGLALAAAIAFCLALATVITRRYRHIHMTPAVCLATFAMMIIGAVFGQADTTSAIDLWYLFLFGSVQLGAGSIFFMSGARLIPAGEAALLGLLECILGPIWVWILLGENPGIRALFGGAIVIGAVACNTYFEMRRGTQKASYSPTPPIA